MNSTMTAGRPKIFPREQLVKALARRLRREHAAFFAMALILTAAGLAAFLTSLSLLVLGLEAMGVRYGLAALVGYLVFLWACRRWLQSLAENEPKLELDIADFASNFWPDSAPSAPEVFQPGGGSFGGAGHSSSFVDPPSLTPPGKPVPSAKDLSPGIGSKSGTDFSLDDGLAWLAVGAIVIALVAAPTYLLINAPEFLAELVVDGFVSFRVYRRLTKAVGPGWLNTALRKSAPAFVLLFTVLIFAGSLLQAVYPGAMTLGDVLRVLTSR
ncbi:MAG: hypothetical protein KatS3mg007_1355 [Thermoanaerobaculum sp.]|nr:MAG: hypothetical protein KatS3mg007_1355 [Thermoanaerobaculum sp.]